MDKATQNHLEFLEKRIKIYIKERIIDLDNRVTDKHILTNDRINEAFDIIKMLERKISQ